MILRESFSASSIFDRINRIMPKKCGSALAFCEDALAFYESGRVFFEDAGVFCEDALAFSE